jgi:tricorn protease
VTTGYLRHPSVHGDRVVFVCEDDLWEVPLEGGVARRLTSGRGVAARPIFSPDGARIAFTSSDESHPEAWVMPSEGGPATRLTHLGANASARAWDPAGNVIVTSSHEQAFARLAELYAVDVDGGWPQRLGLGPASDISWSQDGKVVLGRHTVDPARWKRYRGGLAGQLWVDRDGSGTFRRILRDLGGNIGTPTWVGRRIFFVSDHEGVGNVYSCRATGSDLQRHSHHGDFYARFPNTDGETLVYQAGAKLYRLDPAGDAPEQIEVELHSPRVQRKRRLVATSSYLQGFEVHPAGHSVAIEARGQAHSMPLWERASRRWDSGEGVRSRHGQWLAGGTRFVAITDADGEDGIDVFEDGATSPTKRLSLDIGRPVDVVASPTDPVLAITNHRGELLAVDIDAGKVRRIDRSEHDRIEDPAWSPDGRWLAYALADTPRTSSIRIADATTGRSRQVTRTEFRDYAPAWDPKGRWLNFLSWRDFEPVYDSHTFDLGFPRGSRPLLVTLRPDVRSPFDREPRGLGAAGDDAGASKADTPKKSAASKQAAASKTTKAKSKAKAGTKDAAPVKNDATRPDPVEIEFGGIEDRVIAFPVPESRYEQVAQTGDKVLLLVHEPQSASVWHESKASSGRLEAFDTSTGSHDVLVSGVDEFRLGADGATLVYRTGRSLRAIKAGDKPDDAAKGFTRKAGWLDLSRIALSVDPPLEWRQMLLEAWRLQRDQFWTEDMSGVDWDIVRDRYLPLIDVVASRAEFSDLAWEMQGELGTSHAYEFGGDHRGAWEFTSGHLGIDYDVDAKTGAVRVGRILRGDSWDGRNGSPLAVPGLGVREGSTIVSIGGEAVSRDRSPHELLVGRAGSTIELELREPRQKKTRTVAVRTLRAEHPLRYRDWVEHNRAIVHERTDGKVGYVHIPDMGAHGFAEFHRAWPAEAQRGGLVVDVRCNGGGHVSQLLLEKLQRRAIAFGLSRWSTPETYPSDAVLGPMVAITNELAGSDGDIFSHAFKMLGLGPLVGTRTWGGVIGIYPRHSLADGSMTTQPEYAFWFRDTGYAVENYGTDPDHEVDVAPHDYAAGRDPQLDKALDLIGRSLKRTPATLPDFGERPMLALPTLR